MDHLAIPVSDQERSRRFYETYFGFGARPARQYDDGPRAARPVRAGGVELVEVRRRGGRGA